MDLLFQYFLFEDSRKEHSELVPKQFYNTLSPKCRPLSHNKHPPAPPNSAYKQKTVSKANNNSIYIHIATIDSNHKSQIVDSRNVIPLLQIGEPQLKPSPIIHFTYRVVRQIF